MEQLKIRLGQIYRMRPRYDPLTQRYVVHRKGRNGWVMVRLSGGKGRVHNMADESVWRMMTLEKE